MIFGGFLDLTYRELLLGSLQKNPQNFNGYQGSYAFRGCLAVRRYGQGKDGKIW